MHTNCKWSSQLFTWLRDGQQSSVCPVPLEQGTTEEARLGKLAWCWANLATKPIYLWPCTDKILHFNSTSDSMGLLKKLCAHKLYLSVGMMFSGAVLIKPGDVVLNGLWGQEVKNAYYLLKFPKWLSSGSTNSSCLPITKSLGIGLLPRAAKRLGDNSGLGSLC